MINDKSNIDLTYQRIEEKQQEQMNVMQKSQYFVNSMNGKFLKCIDTIWPKVQNPKKTAIQVSIWLEILTIIITLLIFSFYIFFQWESDAIGILKIIGQIVFLMCPIFRLNCGYYRAGKFIDDRQEIIKRYVKDYLFYDICGCLAIFYTQLYEPQTWLERIPILPIFFKFYTLKLLVEDLQEKLNLTGHSVYMWQMFKLFIITWLLCHVIGILYHVVAIAQHHFWGENNTWQHNKGIFEAQWYERYLESFYWAQSTIMLIGSKGDTLTETIFSISTIFMTVGYFATILSSVEIVMNEMSAKNKKYRKDQEALNIFFKLNPHIKEETQSLALNYLKYEYVGHKDMRANQNVNQIIENFPKQLQEKIQNDKYSFIIERFQFLKNNFSYHTLDEISDIIQEEYYMPNQTIIQQQSKNNKNVPKLYLVLKGSVLMNINNTNICKKSQMEYFGERQFFSDDKLMCSVISESFTTLLSIDRNKFMKIIQKNDKDFEAFHEIQHSYRTQNQSEKVNQQCLNCGDNHYENNCNLVKYNPNKNNIIKKHIFDKIQLDRLKFTRKNQNRQRKCKTISQIEEIQIAQQSMQLTEEYEPYIRQIQSIQSVQNSLDMQQINIQNNIQFNSRENSENENSDIQIMDNLQVIDQNLEQSIRKLSEISSNSSKNGNLKSQNSQNKLKSFTLQGGNLAKNSLPKIQQIKDEENNYKQIKMQRYLQKQKTKRKEKIKNKFYNSNSNNTQLNVYNYISTLHHENIQQQQQLQSSQQNMSLEYRDLIQKQNQYNFDQFIVSHKMRKGVIEFEEVFRQFFSSFEKRQDFHYFLIHNNLNIIMKNYNKYKEKQNQKTSNIDVTTKNNINNTNINTTNNFYSPLKYSEISTYSLIQQNNVRSEK